MTPNLFTPEIVELLNKREAEMDAGKFDELAGQPSGVGEPRATMRSVVVRNIKTGELRQDTKLADEPLSEGWEEVGAPEVGEGMREALRAIVNMAHRAWEDKPSIEQMFILIEKRALAALAAPAPSEPVCEDCDTNAKRRD